MPQEYTESELLELARKFSFRSRIDKNVVTGPIMVWGRGSVVRDVNGKEYLDFNSGQMCAALGHNHPRIVQALQEERRNADTQPHEYVQRQGNHPSGAAGRDFPGGHEHARCS